MLEPLIKAIQAAVKPEIILVAGEEYLSHEIHLPPEPRINRIETSSLQSIVDYANGVIEFHDDDYQFFIHVNHHLLVTLMGQASGRRLNRPEFVAADALKYKTDYKFGQFQSIEETIIALQSQFAHTPDRDSVLQVLGNLRDERIKSYSDDGITQAVTTRQGIARAEQTEVPRIVTLKPYRTFAEVDQPESPFLLRLKQGQTENQAPTAALFEVDGGRWKLQAIENIKAFLAAGTEVPIIG